ncbi:MAG: hypothetical protein NUW01_09000 [Gemmatimonadaceae bacterium]|nr:hypothetical protein [Gemmatimonadaceae bacterium]
MNRERIDRELARLLIGGQRVELVENGRSFVIYHQVPTGGAALDLPAATDVIVPVPEGYPASMIDLAGLPVGSPLLGRVKGGQNSQGVVRALDRDWQLASYHPHNGGGGPPWDQLRFGFHTYFDQVLAWLDRLN